jgi:hypothetical protein
MPKLNNPQPSANDPSSINGNGFSRKTKSGPRWAAAILLQAALGAKIKDSAFIIRAQFTSRPSADNEISRRRARVHLNARDSFNGSNGN